MQPVAALRLITGRQWVDINNNFSGLRLRTNEFTKSASLVTTTRASRIANSTIMASEVRFCSGKSSV